MNLFPTEAIVTIDHRRGPRDSRIHQSDLTLSSHTYHTLPPSEGPTHSPTHLDRTAGHQHKLEDRDAGSAGRPVFYQGLPAAPAHSGGDSRSPPLLIAPPRQPERTTSDVIDSEVIIDRPVNEGLNDVSMTQVARQGHLCNDWEVSVSLFHPQACIRESPEGDSYNVYMWFP